MGHGDGTTDENAREGAIKVPLISILTLSIKYIEHPVISCILTAIQTYRVILIVE